MSRAGVRRALVLVGVAVAVASQAGPRSRAAEPPPISLPSAPVALAPPPIALSPAPIAIPPALTRTDACGAAQLAWLVGRPRTEIPVPVAPAGRRVVCSTCPATAEVVPSRQTIVYDAHTNLVVKVGCG